MPTSPIFDRGLLFLESSIVTLVGHYRFIEDLFWGEMFQKGPKINAFLEARGREVKGLYKKIAYVALLSAN